MSDGPGPGPGPARRRGRSTRDGQEHDSPGRPLGSALDAYLRSQGHGETWLFGAVCGCWGEAVGPEVAAHASPRALRDGVLVVAVDHPGWATQLAFLGERILGQLEGQVGRPVADRLKVTVRGHAGVE